jgi:glycosyltransferase involved in cell wall biosynthesis
LTSVRIIAPGRDFRYVAKHPLDMAEVLARHNFQVEVVNPMPSDVVPIHSQRGFRITPTKGLVSRLVPAAEGSERFALSLLRSLPFADITIGVDPPGFMVAHLLKKLGRTKYFIYYAMELCLPEEVPDQQTAWYQANHIRDADLVIITGEHRAKIMQDRFGLVEQPMVVHNSFVLPERIERSVLLETLEDHGYEPAGQLVIFVGKLFDQHALTQVVKSMTDWPTDVGLVLIGYGDRQYVKKLLLLADNYHVSDKLYYLGSVPPHPRNVFRLIAGADVGLVLKKYRGCILNDVYYTPTKLLEYGAMGIPVICSDQESLRIVEKDGWGINVDIEHPSNIARAVSKISTDPELRDRMGKTARRLFEQKYCMEQQMQPVFVRFAKLAGGGA